MRRTGFLGGVMCTALLAGPVQAQQPQAEHPQAQQPSVEMLMRKLDALQRRVDELEGRDRVAKSSSATKHRAAAGPAAGANKSSQGGPVQPPSAVTIAPSVAVAARGPASQPAAANIPIPGLLPPEPMGSQFEDALRSDLPGLSFRIPGTASEARFYGFAKVSGYRDFNGRNQTDAPAPQGIPLAGSPADVQGGDFGMTARFSRIGLDTRTLTTWGTLETRVEGDFGGGAAVSNNALFRLRQAWAELGTAEFRVLVGQANSLWNEGMFETLIDSTNLNQSFVRQAQVRATATLAPGLTGQISVETPDTQYTSVAGVFTPISSPIGGLSPAFTSVPDFLGRLTYRNNGLEVDLRGLVRQLTVRTDGTAAAPPGVTLNTVGWGVAAHARMPMRWLSEAFGPDQLIGMAYYGEGIGRYFAGNTSGQDAISNIGLPGVGLDARLDALPAYGATVAYRRFWTPQVRSNFAYSAAWQEYPAYALMFIPGSAAATSLNATMQQGIANVIWSPFAELRGNTVDTGWLDVGLEYVYTRRDLFGGAAADAPLGAGFGTANRILASAIGRF